MSLLIKKNIVLSPVGQGDNLLYSQAGTPSLDLRFAGEKSLRDFVTGRDLVTFTRASSATYTDSQGVIRNAVTNSILRSEEFGNAYWTLQNASVSTNGAAAPTGAITADKLVENASNAKHTIYSGAIGAGTYTFSIYVKAAERSTIQVEQESGGDSRFTASGAGTAVALGANTASIQSLGDGWYRCRSTFTTAGNFRVYISLYTTGATYLGDGTSGLFLWGAQLEQSSTVGEYVPTGATINSAPRFDHNPVTGESLGLLVEEQRQNLLLQSEDFSTTWSTTRASITTNVITAPNGATTADKLVENSENNSHFVAQTNSLTSGVAYTASVYAKAGERSILQASISGIYLTTLGYVNFNLSTGAVTVTDGGASGSIVPVGDGWYRCIVNFTANATASGGFAWMLQASPTATRGASYQGDNTSGLYLWGAQLEAGSFPTSYIPTTTTAVTRSADVASIAGAAFSSWYRQDEGTAYVNAVPTTVSTRLFAAFNDGTNQNAINMFYNTNARSQVNTGNVEQALLVSAASAVPTVLAAAYRTNDVAQSARGLAPQTDTSAALPTVDRLTIGALAGGAVPVNGPIARLTYWPRRLGNEVLQKITT